MKLALLTGGNAYELFWPHHRMKPERLAHVPAPWTVAFGPASEVGDGVEASAPSAAAPKTALAALSLEDGERGVGMAEAGESPPGVSEPGNGSSAHGGQANERLAAPTVPAPPSAAEVASLLRQSVEIRSVRSLPAADRRAVDAGHAAASERGEGMGERAREPEDAPMAEALEELASEGAQHVGGAVGATALARGVEILDALRPKPGPLQVVVQAQRPPADLDRPQSGQVPASTQSRERAKERSS